MSQLKKALAVFVIVFAGFATIAGSSAWTTPTPGEVCATSRIRFCCTPQQVAACNAQGGATSCRNDLCRCFF